MSFTSCYCSSSVWPPHVGLPSSATIMQRQDRNYEHPTTCWTFTSGPWPARRWPGPLSGVFCPAAVSMRIFLFVICVSLNLLSMRAGNSNPEPMLTLFHLHSSIDQGLSQDMKTGGGGLICFGVSLKEWSKGGNTSRESYPVRIYTTSATALCSLID